MIKIIHDRLVNWGEAVVGGSLRGAQSSVGFEFSESEKSFGSVGLWSEEIEATERAVCSLCEGLRECVKELYLHPDSTMQQKAVNLHLSESTLRRQRNKAHKLVYEWFVEERIRV